MDDHAFPRKPYDQVQSEFIREKIRNGSFHDLEYRRYVNELIGLEWHVEKETDSWGSGIAAHGATVNYWQTAAMFPEEYDQIMRELDAPTRAEHEWSWNGVEDDSERQQWAQRHATEWQAVKEGTHRPAAARTELETSGSRSFTPFRFPVAPYDAIQSEYIRDRIRNGSFDDFEYRRHVNELVWIEWYTTDWDRGSTFGQQVKNWKLAALYPEEFDTIRRELNVDARESLEVKGTVYQGDIESEEKTREYEQAWRTVQNTSE